MGEVIAFIPARSGSQRLPEKNVMELLGHPLAAHSVMQALALPIFDRVIFSSDSNEYGRIVHESLVSQGIPDDRFQFHHRNRQQAGSQSKIFDVMQHLFGGSELGGEDDDLIVLMLPTAPLRSAQTLVELVSLCKGTGRDCFTCCMYDFHVSFAFEIDTDRNQWRPLIDNSPMCTGNTRSQDQATFFHPHGGAAGVWRRNLRGSKLTIYECAIPVPTDRIEGADVDTLEDFEFVSTLMGSGQPFFPFLKQNSGREEK